MAFTYRRNGTRFIRGCWQDALGNELRGSLETEDETKAKARSYRAGAAWRGARTPPQPHPAAWPGVTGLSPYDQRRVLKYARELASKKKGTPEVEDEP